MATDEPVIITQIVKCANRPDEVSIPVEFQLTGVVYIRVERSVYKPTRERIDVFTFSNVNSEAEMIASGREAMRAMDKEEWRDLLG